MKFNKLAKEILSTKSQLDKMNTDSFTLSAVSPEAEEQIEELMLSAESLNSNLDELQTLLLNAQQVLNELNFTELSEQFLALKNRIANLLLAIKNVRIPPDPYILESTEFVAPPQSQLLQGYDFLEQNINASFGFDAGNILFFNFCIKPDSIGVIKLSTKFKILNENCNSLFKIFLNGTMVKEQSVEVAETNTEQEIKLCLNSFLFEKSANYVTLSVQLNNENSIIEFLHYKFEILGFNADILNANCPTSVTVFGNNYLVADCLTQPIKFGQAVTNLLMKKKQIDFTTTDIFAECFVQNFTTSFESNSYNFANKIALFKKPNLKWNLKNFATLSEQEQNYLNADLFESLTSENDKIKVVATTFDNDNFTNKIVVETFDESLTKATSQQVDLCLNCVKICTVKHMENYLNWADLSCVVCTKNDGTNTLYFNTTTGSPFVDVGYGKNVSAYYVDYVSNNNFKVEIYLKVFSKIVKKIYQFSNDCWTELSCTQVGYYNFYQKAQYGDYFVVKNKNHLFFKYQPVW